jgi:HAE1 family hydrophobic/amphiphilic exporter-1
MEVANVYDGVENDKQASWYNDAPHDLSRDQQAAGHEHGRDRRCRSARCCRRSRRAARVAHAERPRDRSQSIRDPSTTSSSRSCCTVALVVLVIFLFLRNVSATIIPSLALPASIVGTFAVMYLLGYSLDNLSLMALTLSVGFVVDDAIVMLENIVRHMEHGEAPMTAALQGSKEIAFTIVSMTHLARRRLHPRPLHGRHRRTSAARIRGHDRRRHSRVGLRVAQS